jgi:hypothetical protein
VFIQNARGNARGDKNNNTEKVDIPSVVYLQHIYKSLVHFISKMMRVPHQPCQYTLERKDFSSITSGLYIIKYIRPISVGITMKLTEK